MTVRVDSGRQLHPIVRLNRIVRILGCPIPGLIVASARLGADEGMPWLLWLVFGFYGLLWPHVAFGLARRSPESQRQELRSLAFDAAIAGVTIATASFRTVPTLAIVTGYASLLASVGGVHLLATGLGALLATTLATAWLFTGFAVATETSILSNVLSALLLFGFQLMLALQTYRTARSFVQSRRKIVQQGEELEAQNLALVEAREEALQAAQAKAAFLATMSHEIRTPLNGALGMTRLLAETALSDDQRDMVRTIQLSDTALLAIINDVLDYSKIESGRMELEEELLSVTETVEDALQLAAARAREKGLELVCDVAPDLPDAIYGDPTRLRQVLTNLVGNAVKFTEHGEVTVSVRLTAAAGEGEPAEIAFEVTDTGIGIPEDRIPRLFSPFSQVDASTTRRYGGTGLGLAICKRLTELMGGALWARSVLGQGSTFGFTIRAVVASGRSDAERQVALEGKHVLIVDDNATNLRVLAGQLEAWGLEAYSTDGAAEALGALESEACFDLAILDLHMPDLDGLALAHHIRQMPMHGELPLILLSSSPLSAKEDPEQLFAARLTKPARQSKLFDTIMATLGARARPRPSDHTGPGLRRMAEEAPLAILVADDNDVNRKVAGLVFKRFGYDVDFAVDGQQAVDRVVHRAFASAGEEPLDLVFMDVHMPEMDGLEATRAIREAARERPSGYWPRIVAMTADAMQGDREVCLAAGMDDYLTKPLDFAAVQAVLEETARSRPRRPKPPRAALEAAAGAPEEPRLSRVEVPAPERASPTIDWSRLEELREYDSPDGAVVRGAITSFVEQVPARLAEIRHSAAQQDGPALRAAAHALKGAATNIGAVAVAASAAPLEEAGKAASFDAVAPDVDRLATSLVRTLVELHGRASGSATAT